MPVTYGAGTFTIGSGADNTMRAESGTTCTVSVGAGTATYSIGDNQMPLTVSGRVVIFSKISD